MKKVFKNEKGVALIWTMVTLLVLMIIAGSMADVMVKESRISSSIDGSIRAFAAADSGLERATWLTKQTTTVYPYSLSNEKVDPTDTNSPAYTITIARTGTSPNYFYDIESIGKTGNIARKVVKKIDQSTTAQPTVTVYSTSVTLDPASGYYRTHNSGITVPTSSSYTQEFVFDAVSAIPSGTSIMMGMSETTNYTDAIALQFFSSTGLRLFVNGTASSTETFSGLVAGNRYRVKIEYKAGLVTMATLTDITTDATVGTCILKVTNTTALSRNFTKFLYSYYSSIGNGNNIVQSNPALTMDIGPLVKIYSVSLRLN